MKVQNIKNIEKFFQVVDKCSGSELSRGVSGEELKARLVSFHNKTVDMKKFRLWKGKTKNEEKDSE